MLQELSDNYSELEGAFKFTNFDDDILTTDFLDQVLSTKQNTVSAEFKITQIKLTEMFMQEMMSGESLFDAFKEVGFIILMIFNRG